MLKIDNYRAHHVLTFNTPGKYYITTRFWWFNKGYDKLEQLHLGIVNFEKNSIYTDYGKSSEELHKVAENIKTIDDAVKFCMDYLNKII